LYSLIKPQEVPKEVSEWEKADQVERDHQQRLMDIAQDELTAATETLDALSRLAKDKWPELSNEKRKLLATECGTGLEKADLRKNILWDSDTHWHQPGRLRMWLNVVDRYELELDSDLALIQSLRAFDHEQVLRYCERRGVTKEGLAELRDITSNPAEASGAFTGVLAFLREMRINDVIIVSNLRKLVTSGQPLDTKARALDVLIAVGVDTDSLTGLAKEVTEDELKTRIDTALLDFQHGPTIKEKLGRLLSDPEPTLKEAEAAGHFRNPLDWLGRIQTDEYWPILTKLRANALKLSLPNAAGIVTNTMARIDALRLADTIRKQMDITPAEWRPYQTSRALEHEREGTIRAAQSAPFDKVLRRLRRTTTIRLFKVWVEGARDMPGLEALAKQLAGDVSEDITVQSINGWASILTPEWKPTGLWDGCHDLIVILDGDRARDFSKAKRPLRSEIAAVTRKLKHAGIDYVILERYALENYFSQSAYEKVFGPQVAQYFPLDDGKSVASQIPTYQKTRNGDLAAATSLADLTGTDLLDALKSIEKRARK
jgi:hypothetical protein